MNETIGDNRGLVYVSGFQCSIYRFMNQLACHGHYLYHMTYSLANFTDISQLHNVYT
jgi:hypothetical protein